MQILTTPHPFLKHKAKPITSWDKKTARQVEEMATLLKNATNPQGVGLAATQVGLDKRLFILLDDRREAISIFINPKIIKASSKTLADVYTKKKDRWLEGCLSIPGIWGFVDRPFSITLEYQTPSSLKTENCELKIVREELSDVKAAYVQHEIDHLDGILFTDRIRQQNGRLFRETDSGLVSFDPFQTLSAEPSGT